MGEGGQRGVAGDALPQRLPPLQCPVNPGTDGYKNAITNELFLTSAMKLHAYEAIVGKPAGYYLGWAIREWDWFAASGLVNAQSLINDGLDGNCSNNHQTTWTYNQGVLLDGAARLSAATGDAAALDVASRVAAAAMTLLVTYSGSPLMAEPCGGSGGGCGSDASMFKGVFVRHLSAMLQTGTVGPAFVTQARAFLAANAASALANASCGQGDYGLQWQGPCGADFGIATTTAAGLDLFTAAALAGSAAHSGLGEPAALGPGLCVDAAGAVMPSCFNSDVTEDDCAAALSLDTKAAAYDFSQPCLASRKGACRVRTLSGAGSCAPGWTFEGGAATDVSAANGDPLAVCVSRSLQVATLRHAH